MKNNNKYNKKKKNKSFKTNNIKISRYRITMIIMFIIFALLAIRILWIQFISGSSLRESAYRQQTLNRIISPKRGTIYDSNGKVLATSASVDTVTVNPSLIKKENKEKIAKALSDIFELDYETVLNQVSSSNALETIIKKVEHDKVAKFQEWMKENKISSGINIDEDYKRYYPYGNLASHVIGFTGTDDQGLYGIESKWNSSLQGVAGKIVTTADVNHDEISRVAEQYVEVENGSDLYLTIDVNIQSIVEKHLEEGVKNIGAMAGSAIAMKPSTGDILAMATYPSYDLNTPFSPNTEELSNKWDTLTAAEKSEARYKMWSERNFSSTYEPGSTFKVIMSAIALEENITKTNIAGDFSCTGSMSFGTKRITTIRCAHSKAHGIQTLKQALGNSCNSAFMQLGARIGTNTLYKYFEAFGLFKKTGIAISGESSSRFHSIDSVGPVELATTSFGQRFEITPLQLITAISSIANDGKLMQPRIVKQVTNSDTNIVTNIDTNSVRQVVSEETATKVRDMMQYVVTDGGGSHGAVQGYSVGGKTGTSEPMAGRESEGYTVSFIAISPTDKPEIIILVAIYKPATSNPYGSTIAAPIVSKMLSEILPYMGIASETSNMNVNPVDVTKEIPDVKNKTLTEAEKIIKSVGFNVSYPETQNANSQIVTEQVPNAGTKLYSNSTVILYTKGNSVRTSETVPNLVGMTLAQAKSALSEKKLNISYSGSGTVASQNIEADTSVEQGTIIKVVLK